MDWRKAWSLGAIAVLAMGSASAGEIGAISGGSELPVRVAQADTTPAEEQQPASAPEADDSAAEGGQSETPAPAGGRELETITVKPSRPSAPKRAAARKKRPPSETAPAPGEGGPPQAPTSTTEGEGPARPESVWGPVDGFVATRSATGTKTDTPIVETPQSISVITADRIEQLGATTLNDAVAYTAGVRPNTYGRDCRYDWLSIRGFDAYYPGFYFDGLFTRNNNTWAVWRADPQGAERIEVLKGPSSVLYGQTNPGGLINIVSKRPTDERFLEVETQFGNRDHLQPAFDMGGPVDENGKVLYRVTGRGLMTDTDVDFADCNQAFIAPSLTFRPSADTSVTILGHYLERDAGIDVMFLPAQGSLRGNPNGRIRSSTNLGEPGFDGFDQSQWMLGYLLEHRFNDVWQMRQNTRYGRLDVRLDQVYGLGLDPLDPSERSLARRAFFSDETVGQFLTDTQLQAKFATGAAVHTLLFGVDYQHNSFDQLSGDGEATSIDMFDPVYGAPIAAPPLFADADTKLVQTGVYAQEQLKLFPVIENQTSILLPFLSTSRHE